MARKSRSLDNVELPPWRFVVFSDLHVSAKTIDRVLDVLATVRMEAVARRAKVVFTGDFWDLREALSVRQLSRLIDEFELWRKQGVELIIIPGNHDQVTVDGRVHGVRPFEAFHNIYVATERLLWPEHKIAFIPWRQDADEQSAQFDLDGDGWTIFAHAEVEGATTNHAYKAPGRVSLAKIQSVARACYCGHYHKRQKLGDRTWYIGNPYELNFGEMGEPKGIAYLERGMVEPEWIPIEGLPRHHRLTLGKPFDLDAIGEQDIVELYAPMDELGGDRVTETIRTIPAKDVRPLPIPSEETDDSKPPTIALTLDQAIDAYVDQYAEEAEEAGTDLVPGVSIEDLKGLGRAILSEVPESQGIQPLHPEVRITKLRVSDFCALRGTVELGLDRQGLVLFKGPIGVGKTALVDALTWGLYGQTSPRKAGSHGSTFRGDEVIHDDATECVVSVDVRLGDGREVRVTRSKSRKQGSQVSFEGADVGSEGISDSQHLINRIMGLNYGLWRACVALGQGAVGNFVTDSDKARKELLMPAFGLDVCAPGQKLVRERLKSLRSRYDELKTRVATVEERLRTLQGQDYQAQIQGWEEQRNSELQAADATIAEAQAVISQCDEHLQGEDQWLQLREQHQARLEQVTDQLSKLTAPNQAAELERQVGGLQAERQSQSQQLAKAIEEHRQLESVYENRESLPCPTCGKPMENVEAERYVVEKAHEVERLRASLADLQAKEENLQGQLADLRKGGDAERESLQAQIAESRAALEKIGEALSQFSRIRANREQAEYRFAEATRMREKRAGETNPWQARQLELQEQIGEAQKELDGAVEERDQIASQVGALDFWDGAFGARGIPMLVLRTVAHELEGYANNFLADLLGGRVFCRLNAKGDDLQIDLYEQVEGEVYERRYEQLSGGQRRCLELAFTPFGLSEMVFSRAGVRVPVLVVDELTTHLGQEQKPLVCEILRSLERDTVLVIDHDIAVQSEFDVVYELRHNDDSASIVRSAA